MARESILSGVAEAAAAAERESEKNLTPSISVVNLAVFSRFVCRRPGRRKTATAGPSPNSDIISL